MILDARLVCVLVCVCLHTRTHAAAVPAIRSPPPQRDVLLTQLLRALQLYNVKGVAKGMNSSVGYHDSEAMKFSPDTLANKRNIEDMAVLVYLSSSSVTDPRGRSGPRVRIEYVPRELVFGNAQNSSGTLYPVQYFAVRKTKTKIEEDSVHRLRSEGKEALLNRKVNGRSTGKPAQRSEHLANHGKPLIRRSRRELWSSHNPSEGPVQHGRSAKQPSWNLPLVHERSEAASTGEEARDLLVMQEQQQEEEGAISRQFGPLASVGSGLLSQLQFAFSNTGVVVSILILCGWFIWAALTGVLFNPLALLGGTGGPSSSPSSSSSSSSSPSSSVGSPPATPVSFSPIIPIGASSLLEENLEELLPEVADPGLVGAGDTGSSSSDPTAGDESAASGILTDPSSPGIDDVPLVDPGVGGLVIPPVSAGEDSGGGGGGGDDEGDGGGGDGGDGGGDDGGDDGGDGEGDGEGDGGDAIPSDFVDLPPALPTVPVLPDFASARPSSTTDVFGEPTDEVTDGVVAVDGAIWEVLANISTSILPESSTPAADSSNLPSLPPVPVPRPTTLDGVLPVSWVGLPSQTPADGDAVDTETHRPTPSYSVLHACLVLGGDVPSCVAQAELYGLLLHKHAQGSAQTPTPEDSTPSGIEVIQQLHPSAEILENLPGLSSPQQQQQQAPDKDQYIENNFPHADVVVPSDGGAVKTPLIAQVIDDLLRPQEAHLPVIQQLLSQVQSIQQAFASEQFFQNVVKNPPQANEDIQAHTVPSIWHQFPQTTNKVNEEGESVPVFQDGVEGTEERPPQTHPFVTFVLQNTSQSNKTSSLLAAIDDTVTPENYQTTAQAVQEEPPKIQLIQEKFPHAHVQIEPLDSQPLLSDPPHADALVTPNVADDIGENAGVQSQLEAVSNVPSSTEEIQNFQALTEAGQILSDGAEAVKVAHPHLEGLEITPQSTTAALSLYPDQGLLHSLLLLHSQPEPEVEHKVNQKTSDDDKFREEAQTPPHGEGLDSSSNPAAPLVDPPSRNPTAEAGVSQDRVEATKHGSSSEEEILVKPLLADLIGSDREVPSDAAHAEGSSSSTRIKEPSEGSQEQLSLGDTRAQMLKKFPHAQVVSSKPTRFFRGP